MSDRKRSDMVIGGFVATLANIPILVAHRSCPKTKNRLRRGPRDFFSNLLKPLDLGHLVE
jgi:hypothetical protein